MALQDHVRVIGGAGSWTYEEEICGHCGRPSNIAIIALVGGRSLQQVGVCSGCHGVNVLTKDGKRFPVARPGNPVDGLTESVALAWAEARDALGAGAPIASEHMCRKILIHVASEVNGAPRRMTFQEAIALLVESKTITEPMKAWVGKIRDHGNDAAHELEPPDPARARITLEFTEQLLRVVYETKHRLEQLANPAPARGAPKPPTTPPTAPKPP